MKLLKKLLPLTTAVSAVAIAVPLATSCTTQNKKWDVEWDYTDGAYFPSHKMLEGKTFLIEDKDDDELQLAALWPAFVEATKTYFDAAIDDYSIFAEDYAFGYITAGQSSTTSALYQINNLKVHVVSIVDNEETDTVTGMPIYRVSFNIHFDWLIMMSSLGHVVFDVEFNDMPYTGTTSIDTLALLSAIDDGTDITDTEWDELVEEAYFAPSLATMIDLALDDEWNINVHAQMTKSTVDVVYTADDYDTGNELLYIIMAFTDMGWTFGGSYEYTIRMFPAFSMLKSGFDWVENP